MGLNISVTQRCSWKRNSEKNCVEFGSSLYVVLKNVYVARNISISVLFQCDRLPTGSKVP